MKYNKLGFTLTISLILLLICFSCKQKENISKHRQIEKKNNLTTSFPEKKYKVIEIQKSKALDSSIINQNEELQKTIIECYMHGVSNDISYIELPLFVYEYIYGEIGKKATIRQKMDILFLYSLCSEKSFLEYRGEVYANLLIKDKNVLRDPVLLTPLIGFENCNKEIPLTLLSNDTIYTPKEYKTYVYNVMEIINDIPRDNYQNILNDKIETISKQKSIVLTNENMIWKKFKKALVTKVKKTN